jgi:ribonuclease P protein component
MAYTFKKNERLKSRKTISAIFTSGDTISAYPIKLYWISASHEPAQLPQFGFSVPKKKFKLAVERNRIKRLMREAVRLNKSILTDGTNFANFALMFLYIGNEEANFKMVETKVVNCLTRLKDKKI